MKIIKLRQRLEKKKHKDFLTKIPNQGFFKSTENSCQSYTIY